MIIKKIMCPHCGKELKEKSFVSFAEFRRLEQQIINNHIQRGDCHNAGSVK